MGDHRGESENIAVWDCCLLVCLRNGTSLYPGMGRKERNIYLNRGRVGRHTGAITNLPSKKHLAEYLHLMLSSKYSKHQWVSLPISPWHTCLPGGSVAFTPADTADVCLGVMSHTETTESTGLAWRVFNKTYAGTSQVLSMLNHSQ